MRAGEAKRRLTAELGDDAERLLAIADGEHLLGGKRLEVEPVGGVVVGRDRLRVAVDHHRLVAERAERLRRMHAAVVELDPLADAVRAGAEDDDARLVASWCSPRLPRPRSSRSSSRPPRPRPHRSRPCETRAGSRARGAARAPRLRSGPVPLRACRLPSRRAWPRRCRRLRAQRAPSRSPRGTRDAALRADPRRRAWARESALLLRARGSRAP